MKAHPALTAEHEALRDTMRRFVAREITPHAAAWDEAEEFPRALYRKAAAAGLLGIGFPEEYGGTPADLFTHVILAEEIALAGVGGVHAGLFSHQIGAPPVARAGSAGAESARAACRARGREDQRARDHRAGRRLGRREPYRPARSATAATIW